MSRGVRIPTLEKRHIKKRTAVKTRQLRKRSCTLSGWPSRRASCQVTTTKQDEEQPCLIFFFFYFFFVFFLFFYFFFFFMFFFFFIFIFFFFFYDSLPKSKGRWMVHETPQPQAQPYRRVIRWYRILYLHRHSTPRVKI